MTDNTIDLEEGEFEEVEASATESPGPTVLILTPCMDGKNYASFTRSLLKLQQVCMARGITLYWEYEANESLITRARCRMLTQFIENPMFTHVMWIDSDITFEPEQFLALLDADVGVIAAAYPLKRYFFQEEGEPAKPTAAILQYAYSIDGGQAKIIDGRRIEALDVATGFMLIQRDVIEQMIEAYPESFVSDSVGDAGKRHYLLFDTMLDGDRFLSEDYAFCRRWQKLGGKVYLDIPASRLAHSGTVTYVGDLPEALKANGQFTDPEPKKPARKRAAPKKAAARKTPAKAKPKKESTAAKASSRKPKAKGTPSARLAS